MNRSEWQEWGPRPMSGHILIVRSHNESRGGRKKGKKGKKGKKYLLFTFFAFFAFFASPSLAFERTALFASGLVAWPEFSRLISHACAQEPKTAQEKQERQDRQRKPDGRRHRD